MRTLRLTLILLFASPALAEPPIAIVSWLEGSAEEVIAEDSVRPLRLFDRLRPESRIRTAQGSELVLAYADGRRFTIEASSEANVGRSGVKAARGNVRELSSVPALPFVSRLEPGLQIGHRPAAGRIRSGLSGPYLELSPSDGAELGSGPVILRFAAPADDALFRVSVENRQGELVFETETGEREIEIEIPGGETYFWVVQGLEAHRDLRADAVFHVLGSDDATLREELKATYRETRDASVLTLLTAFEFDRSRFHEGCLNLRRENVAESITRIAKELECKDERLATELR